MLHVRDMEAQTASTMAGIPPPPPGFTYIALVTPCLKLLIIGTVWAATLVPLLVLLLFLSNPKIHRQPIFLMNVFSVTMGIVVGIMNMKIYVCVHYYHFKFKSRY